MKDGDYLKYIKFSKLLLMIVLLFNFLDFTYVFGDEYCIKNTKLDVKPNKIWSIKFNKDIDTNSIKDDSVKVVDSNGNKMDIKLKTKLDDSTVLEVIPPDEGYVFGETYTLYVSDDIKDVSGNKLSKPVRMKFTIKSTEYDYATAKVEVGNEHLSNIKVIKVKNTSLKSAVKYWVENQFSEYDNEKVYIGAKAEVIILTDNAIVHFYDAEDNEVASGVLNVGSSADNIQFNISK
ncbi:hypothetical protein CLTEP_13180 [Clostridium tepidiprofundi DSM 19306]|uniref:SbsA Ig-like domain-containing protein n=1 Tax=Clostridium tepidiprofundi DSM 19306 TaxID=1121338 RepID=A0A151B473_9CLOT|nr:Ig-like domain-containing protein [Clostridium tepidiprofundi]KYH34721.1 hypothetical protein CLTEP_13180 [Clostridium tepidiprofundi DSM 19306]